jgi:hypothetical protein
MEANRKQRRLLMVFSILPLAYHLHDLAQQQIKQGMQAMPFV